jgi:hypothetical protein
MLEPESYAANASAWKVCLSLKEIRIFKDILNKEFFARRTPRAWRRLVILEVLTAHSILCGADIIKR